MSLPPRPQITSSPSVPMRMSSSSVPTIVQPSSGPAQRWLGGGGEITVHVCDAGSGRCSLPCRSPWPRTCGDRIETRLGHRRGARRERLPRRGCTQTSRRPRSSQGRTSAVVDVGHLIRHRREHRVRRRVRSRPTGPSPTAETSLTSSSSYGVWQSLIARIWNDTISPFVEACDRVACRCRSCCPATSRPVPCRDSAVMFWYS